MMNNIICHNCNFSFEVPEFVEFVSTGKTVKEISFHCPGCGCGNSVVISSDKHPEIIDRFQNPHNNKWISLVRIVDKYFMGDEQKLLASDIDGQTAYYDREVALHDFKGLWLFTFREWEKKYGR